MIFTKEVCDGCGETLYETATGVPWQAPVELRTPTNNYHFCGLLCARKWLNATRGN